MEKPLIMVIDDEKDMADEIALTITANGKYEPVVAYSAKDALKTLKSNRKLLGKHKNKVRCIILDIKMPEMDGLQFLKKIRKEYNEDHIGVIMLTAYEDAEKWEKATSGFVSAYLKKPFKGSEIINTLDRHFSGEKEQAKMVIETFEEHIEKRKGFKENK